MLGGYAIFHALVGSVFLVWSILRLRVLALRDKVKRSARPRAAKSLGSCADSFGNPVAGTVSRRGGQFLAHSVAGSNCVADMLQFGKGVS